MSGLVSRFDGVVVMWRWPLRALLVAAVLVPAHDLVFLLGHGARDAGAALAELGHDAYWPMVVAAAVGGILLAAAGGVAIMAVLRGRLATLGGRMPRGAWPAYRARVLHTWPRLAIAALGVFVLQENAEHLFAHAGHLPGIAVLGWGEYAASLPVFALLSFLVACVAALLDIRVAQLAAAVEAAERRRAWRRALRARPRPRIWDVARQLRTLAIPDLGRAPPA